MATVKFATQKAIYLFRSSIVHFFHDGCVIKAAGLSWFLFLTIVPMLILVLSIASRILPPGESVVSFTRFFFDFLEQFTPTQISSIETLVDSAFRSSISSSVVASFIMLWSLLIFYTWVENIFDSIWRIKRKKENFIKSKLHGIGMMFLMIIFLVFSLFVYNGLLLFVNYVDTISLHQLHPSSSKTILYAFNLILAGFTFFTFFKWVPSKKVSTKAAFLSALLSLAIEIIALLGYQLYLEFFGTASFIYGSMFSIIIVMIWMDYTMLNLLFGCEFCKTLHHSYSI